MVRKSGLTFAPESASDGTRQALGKDIEMGVLKRSAVLAYRHGWQRMKLYFMVGFPGEDEDEAKRIVALARELSGRKRSVRGGAAEIKVSVNPFVPKAHTPFQWLGIEKMSKLELFRRVFISSSSKKVRFEIHNLRQSVIEACMSRADRRVSQVIHTAWTRGAKMDGWSEFFDFSIWESSFRDHGLDIYDYASRTFSFEDKLPWDYVKAGPTERFLKEELQKSGFYQQ